MNLSPDEQQLVVFLMNWAKREGSPIWMKHPVWNSLVKKLQHIENAPVLQTVTENSRQSFLDQGYTPKETEAILRQLKETK